MDDRPIPEKESKLLKNSAKKISSIFLINFLVSSLNTKKGGGGTVVILFQLSCYGF